MLLVFRWGRYSAAGINGSVRIPFLILLFLGSGISGHPQSMSTPPVVAPVPATSGPVSATSAPVAYDSAELPKDRVQAWNMLRAATTLDEDTMQPWIYRAHYKTYDAYGKPQGDGTIEYVWGAPGKWHSTYTEGSKTWLFWRNSRGVYAPAGQTTELSYPASLILKEILYPLGFGEQSKVAPIFFADEKFGAVTLSCFRNTARVQPEFEEGPFPDPTPQRICTVPGKPYLRFTQGNYSVFFDKISVFQHRITAKQLLIKDGNDPVVEVTMDSLETASDQQIGSLEPPAEAVLLHPKLPPGSTVSPLHIEKRPSPRYPPSMVANRVAGTVRLSGVIQKDGSVRITDVLHSPAPELTEAAEEAVKQWRYTPGLLDGSPVERPTVISINFSLGRR